MTAVTADPAVGALPVPSWAWLALALVVAVAGLWLVSFENGEVMSVLGQARELLHETFHDGRHLLGVPCH